MAPVQPLALAGRRSRGRSGLLGVLGGGAGGLAIGRPLLLQSRQALVAPSVGVVLERLRRLVQRSEAKLHPPVEDGGASTGRGGLVQLVPVLDETGQAVRGEVLALG